MEESEIRKYVRDRYAGIARQGGSCCGPQTSCCGPKDSCCGSADGATPESASGKVGYSAEEMGAVPEGANLGLGCGNPTALASLEKGETVLDLGAGAGFDCFLAARAVGPSGRVIGVDMTPEMVEKARGNARKHGYGNVEFRLGEIEHLPAADASVDAVISNCVINLSPAKGDVFVEAFRVLKPGGRVMISDIVLDGELPAAVATSLPAYAGCVAGAIRKEEYLRLMETAGFRDVRIVREDRFEIGDDELADYARNIAGAEGISSVALRDASDAIRSVSVFGTKPA